MQTVALAHNFNACRIQDWPFAVPAAIFLPPVPLVLDRTIQVAMIYFQTRSPNPIQKTLAILLGMVMLALGVMFSVILIPIAVLAAVICLGFFWWKTRALRKAIADIRQRHDDSFIEGEAVVVRENSELRCLPDQGVL